MFSSVGVFFSAANLDTGKQLVE